MYERVINLSLFVLAVLGSAGMAGNENLLAGLPVPEEAYDVQEFSVESSRPNQLSFKVDLAYPSKKILELYAEYFAAKGWTACKSRMDDWDSFVDESVGGSPLIHQLLRYWIKWDQNLEAALILRYYSEGVDESRKTPTSAIQHVSVVIIENIPDLDQQLELYGLECP